MAARRVLRAVAALAVALAAGAAWAQAWTVQTVALRDLRQARMVVMQLQALGFDAYDEFAMHDGKEFVRVRVGCYNDRSAARAVAAALADHVTKQAVAAPLTPGAKVQACDQEDIGFLKPTYWKHVDPAGTLPTFRVQVAGHAAELVYDGKGWVVVQAGASAPTSASLPDAVFVQAHPGGVPWVAQEEPSGLRLLCPGTLVGQAGGGAVVERAHEVVACRFGPPPGASGSGSP